MDLAQLVVFVFPAWLANAVPVVFGGGNRIDWGKKFWDGQPVFGKSKTWRGLYSGMAFGFASGAVIVAFFNEFYLAGYSVYEKLYLAFLLSLGAMLGDLLGSFIKRRRGFKEGRPSLVMDKLVFVATALGLCVAYSPPLWAEIGWTGLAFILALTYALHVFFNALAHRLKLKSVPW
ncbi:hypothetical protein COX85_02750 [Candidatus Micrarchaeota archaeon CG_4_10_14_0_2_um_filter_55_9]|nr:MAG: hypothetical protein AUJ15_03265 [Candidatus Micrarchaeota archaeon CG1_02_55_41]PIO02908.1 MAG: hypothetical protein COT57_01690 [Candidatus Micrarchaeota archaeon CG09_land_8_20_14_0_10_55_25]PIZ91661.1 MAG: hypothetical protein COX85_02750 [Candidatus Micrarchaeota archaeon CG_4_10_14_0_2_um_filter_55_9]PJD01604.1 MAG: hypothetical protein COU38_00190 [Candidatus Micrarchaeota archaeon CG10_big_fil_rev_8_21_14_0_10_54_18]